MKKIILITGANRGLGKAIVDVVLNYSNTLIISISRSLNEEHKGFSNDKLIFHKTDLAKPFSSLIFQNINVDDNFEFFFFSNASIILPIKKIGDFESEMVETSINVNIKYSVSLINYLLKTYVKNKITLVNITSGAANYPIAFWAMYCSSKAYMKMFFDVLKKENEGNNKLVFFDFDPGTLDTEMQSTIRQIYFPDRERFVNLKREDKLIKPHNAALKIIETMNLSKN